MTNLLIIVRPHDILIIYYLSISQSILMAAVLQKCYDDDNFETWSNSNKA
jgi:hypothetical protein